MNVLIVDDVDYIRKSISKVLEGNDCQCDVAENGHDALAQLHDNHYDLIITDIMMPGMDGFEFLEQMRSQSAQLAKIPVLAISGGSKTIDSELALKIVDEKADGILQKPFSKSELLEAIAKVIGRQRLVAG